MSEPNGLDIALDEMAQRGQSVDLNWDGELGQWECCWQTGGQFFSGVSPDKRRAVKLAIMGAIKALEENRDLYPNIDFGIAALGGCPSPEPGTG